MKMKTVFKVAIIGIIFLSLNSCATSKKYAAKLDTWLGSDVNNLITSWGPPSDVYTMPNGNKMYTWLWVGSTLVTSNYNSYLNMTLTNAVTYWSKTTFTTDASGKITNWRYEGNACRSN